MTFLYAIFHGNLQFSSIPKNQYKTVINNCYWPLLRILDEDPKLRLGIEFSTLTLLEIKKIDPEFIEKIKNLIEKGKLEFIGSAYTQSIFPLIPYEINLKNLELGKKYYKEILGFIPKIFYVNEQTFSDGLVDLYKKAGIGNIVIDYDTTADNVRSDKKLIYSPIKIKSQSGRAINVIWNSSIAFQKLQRYIFDEISIDDYKSYLSSHLHNKGSFCLYGGDWEVFGFSPKGIKRNYKDDFKRMEMLFDKFAKDKSLEFILPGRLLGGKIAKLETSITDFADPILCKKQEKYNVSRWALAGKNSVLRNTQCFKLFKVIDHLKNEGVDKKIIDKLEKNLVILWGSDYRTNTTSDKNEEYESLYTKTKNSIARFLNGGKSTPLEINKKVHYKQLAEDGKIETDSVHLTLDWRKGATIKELVFPKISSKKIAGLVPHGHFQNTKLSPDWFSAYCVIEAENGKKYTDLTPTKIFVDDEPSSNKIKLKSKIVTEICSIEKKYFVYKKEPRVDLKYIFDFKKTVLKSARIGSITFDPLNFDLKNFWYETVNGGNFKEKYYMGRKSISQDGLISFRISSRGCLGAAEGWLATGDKDKGLLVSWDSSEIASCPIIHFENTPQGLYGQIHHSFAESDETGFPIYEGKYTIILSIKGLKIP